MKDILKQLREKNGLTQEQMAARSDGYETRQSAAGKMARPSQI